MRLLWAAEDIGVTFRTLVLRLDAHGGHRVLCLCLDVFKCAHLHIVVLSAGIARVPTYLVREAALGGTGLAYDQRIAETRRVDLARIAAPRQAWPVFGMSGREAVVFVAVGRIEEEFFQEVFGPVRFARWTACLEDVAPFQRGQQMRFDTRIASLG